MSEESIGGPPRSFLIIGIIALVATTAAFSVLVAPTAAFSFITAFIAAATAFALSEPVCHDYA